MRAASALSFSVPNWRLTSLRISAVWVWVGGLTLLAFALRLFWVLYTDTVPLGGDPHWYYAVGINLARGYGFVAPRNGLFEVPGPGAPTAFWPPGYPFVLAAVFKVFGVSVLAAQVMNATLAAATAPFVYGAGAAIFNRRAGLAAAALYAVFPSAIAWTSVLFPEPLFVFLFVAAVWALVAPRQPSGRATIAFGLLAGMAALTRGEGLVLLPAAMVFWLARSGWRATLRSSALAIVVTAATIAPWTVRNAIEMHAFIPISTNGASVLRSGHAPDATGYTKWTQDQVNGVPMEESHYRPDWEVQSYREYTSRAIHYAVAHPQRELELSGLKLYNTYRSDEGMMPWLTTMGVTPLRPAGLEVPLSHLLKDSYYALFLGAIASVPCWLRRDPRRVFLAALFVFWSLFHVAFVGDVRYHLPMLPFFAIAAAGGASIAFDGAPALLARSGRRRAPAPAPALVAEPGV